MTTLPFARLRRPLAIASAAIVVVVLVVLLAGRDSASTGDSARSGPPRSAADPGPSGAGASGGAQLGEAVFWDLLQSTRLAAGNDTGRQSELLEERLRRLPPALIVDFQRIRHRLDQQAYTWELWAAAYVIEDGCSDDCFRDFRSYLISLGRAPYEAALQDPDSLAPIVQDAEQGDWENADSVAGDAYEDAAGEDIPADDSDISGSPSGEPWDDENIDELVGRYPRLAARFR